MRTICFFFLLIPVVLFGQVEESNYRTWLRTNATSDKLALVIGNSQYQYGTSLREPANDANTIARALKERGYNVVLGYNLDREELYEAVDEFSEKLQDYKETVIYYAGHGFQVNGNNYIIPTDANPMQSRQVARHCMNVNYLLEAINRPEIPKLILIDACRNNPFESNWTDANSRDLRPGMKAIKALENSLVVFSTAENTKVLDENPFAEILANSLQAGGCINSILGKVSVEVRAINKYQLIRPTGIIYPEICFGQRNSNIGDSDGDGLLDHVDNCPNEYGHVANGGCPIPENNFTGNSGTFTDDRDGQVYKWVRLKDGKIWMAENLNYETDDSWCYDNDSDNCEEYGRLYIWWAAEKACPSGWHLPTDNEWWKMTSYYGKSYNSESSQINKEGEVAYKTLIQGGTSGFSALLGGGRIFTYEFYNLGYSGMYWSSSEDRSYDTFFPDVWCYHFDRSNHTLYRFGSSLKNYGRSCRCLKG